MRGSKQRNEILNIILNSCDHPNAETIYFRVKNTIPNISLGTVYRNLCVLVSQGLVRQIFTAYGADRYDRPLTDHAHFICSQCGQLSDIPYDLSAMKVYHQIEEHSGHKIDGSELIFSGVCKNCRNKSED